MSWKEDLEKKAKEFNIKEETNETKSVSKNRSDSSRSSNGIGGNKHTSDSSNSIGGRSRDLFRGRIFEKNRSINNVKKGGNTMISAEAAKGDIEKLIVEAKDITAIGAATVLILKGILVMVKVILTARTNTVKIMEKLGIHKEELKKEPEK